MSALRLLAEFPDRRILWLVGSEPAAYYVADHQAQGILVNAPAFDSDLLTTLQAERQLRYIFLPSRRGALDIERWRSASGVEVLAFGAEAAAIEGTIDLVLDNKSRLTRTIDFLPMSGVTEGSCAMRLKNKPGAVFFGPALSPGQDGWPTLIFMPDDHSMENRLFGALGIQDIAFEYAFTDDFDPDTTRFGPGAGAAVKAAVERALDD